MFKLIADEAIVLLAQNGDDDAMNHLLNKYKPLVHAKASPYFVMGSEPDDVRQIGAIGLFKAIRDYKQDKDSSFRTFAEMCITRNIITAVKTATRQKHLPLNQSASLDKPLRDTDEGLSLADILPHKTATDPEAYVMAQEVAQEVRDKIRKDLSDLESWVLEGYLRGLSYAEIAAMTGGQVRRADNALQRAQKKIQKNFGNVEFC